MLRLQAGFLTLLGLRLILEQVLSQVKVYVFGRFPYGQARSGLARFIDGGGEGGVGERCVAHRGDVLTLPTMLFV